MIRHSKGMTLIEVLLTIFLLSIIGGILWNVLINSMNYSKSIGSKTVLQQEANIMLTGITKIHQTSSTPYTITFDQNPDATYINVAGSSKTIEFNHPEILYSISTYNDTSENYMTTSNNIINPNTMDFPIKITLTAKNNPKLKVEMNTVISKIK